MTGIRPLAGRCISTLIFPYGVATYVVSSTKPLYGDAAELGTARPRTTRAGTRRSRILRMKQGSPSPCGLLLDPDLGWVGEAPRQDRVHARPGHALLRRCPLARLR